MANTNQAADLVALPLVPCPDCGRRVVTFVARRGQFQGERFYKCRNHNVSGSCFYEFWILSGVHVLLDLSIYGSRVEVAELGPVAPPLAQINPGENEVAAANQGGQMQPADGTMPSAASGVVGSQLRAGDVGRRQASFTFDAASINLVVSVGNMAICLAILVLVVSSTVMRAFD
ncbi:hypothetical protein VPH35_133032 [Triticum aestivum]